MFNYYLFHKSYEKATKQQIEESLKGLNTLIVDSGSTDENFLKHESIWEQPTTDGVFLDIVFSEIEDEQFRHTVLPKLLQAIQSVDVEILNFEQFDEGYKLYNAFYGLYFDSVDFDRCITNAESHRKFRQKFIWEVNAESFWERKSILFANLLFCDSVKENINSIGGTYLNQIVIKLRELDRYVSLRWTTGQFNYEDANSNSPLNISPESKKTMGQKKYSDLRYFSLPDGRKECFELHIKTGNLRFHFFPEKNKIYIGYIGSHLATDKFS